MSINKIILVGNLVDDAKCYGENTDTQVIRFSVATDNKYKTKFGDEVKTTEYHRIVSFGKYATGVLPYLKKGKQVYVEGKLTYSNYDDKDGVNKQSVDIRAETIQLL